MKLFRFKSKLATQDRLECFPVSVQDNQKNHWGPDVKEYEQKFSIVGDGKSSGILPILKRKDCIREYRAPPYGEDKYQLCLYFNNANNISKMPDIFSIQDYIVVSDKFKKIIFAFDEEDEYEFIDVVTVGPNWKRVDPNSKYYWFNARRFLGGEGLNLPSEFNSFSFECGDLEAQFLSCVIESDAFMISIENYPVWRFAGSMQSEYREEGVLGALYFSENFYKKLQAANIDGIMPHSNLYGLGEESIVAISSRFGE